MACGYCGGTGLVAESVNQSCGTCGGSGRAYGYGDICMSCGGSGSTTGTQTSFCSCCGGTGKTADDYTDSQSYGSVNQSGSYSKSSSKSQSGGSTKPAAWVLYIDNQFQKIPKYIFALLGVAGALVAAVYSNNRGFVEDEIIVWGVVGFIAGIAVIPLVREIIKLAIAAVIVVIVLSVLYGGYLVLLENYG